MPKQRPTPSSAPTSPSASTVADGSPLDQALMEANLGDEAGDPSSAWDDDSADLESDGASDHLTVGDEDELDGEGDEDQEDDLDEDQADGDEPEGDALVDWDEDAWDEDEEEGDDEDEEGDDEDEEGLPGVAIDISTVTGRPRAFASRLARGDGPGADDPAHRAGFVALAGRPNAGKSTLLNRILGEKLAIMSPKPQTTRNRIMGVHTEPGLQVALIDTPGLHKAHSRMNRSMNDIATAALSEVDVVCWVLDGLEPARRAKQKRPPLDRAEHIVATILQREARGAIVIALNKVDRAEKDWLLPVIGALHELLPQAEIVPVSALRGGGVRQLVDVLRARLPQGPPLFPADTLTDATERFMVAELIREKVFLLTKEELPYATAVEIEQFTDEPEARGGKGRVAIFARILVERDGQKGIIIGRNGSMLKEVGTRARVEIEALLGTSVYLELHVTVRRDWSRDPRTLHALGIE